MITAAALAALTPAQAKQRALYQRLKAVGVGGATRAELVTATGLSLWEVRTALAVMKRNRWVIERRMVEDVKAPYRYWCHPAHWLRGGR